MDPSNACVAVALRSAAPTRGGSQVHLSSWRPNLPDEGDNHVLELAVAAGDAPIVTFNRRDFRIGELRFPGIIVQTPGAWLKPLAPLKE